MQLSLFKNNPLTFDALLPAANDFLLEFSKRLHPNLYGVTDGKAIGTYIEERFHEFLSRTFDFEQGNASLGVDFPSLNIDLKVTSSKMPQSSSPFRSAEQKIYGLGHGLLVFTYDKEDLPTEEAHHLQRSSVAGSIRQDIHGEPERRIALVILY